jgi:SlyX protein
MTMTEEDRLIDIEIMLSRQEDLLDTLNTLVYQQQKQIDQLSARCEALTRPSNLLSDSARAAGAPAHEIPPHY